MPRRMAQHPNAVSFNEAQRVLEAFGWTLNHVRGSHHVFKRGASRIVVPLKRPHIRSVYVKQILEATTSEGNAGGSNDEA